ncbi:hypothetical protein JOQ06_000659 [Pogonophryne albipinna]|uniref:Uncharacterized protein n=1 Tax=Pogonophryne albipinna TaxID=1090488 RepID=A0AAD6F7C3_9TELE|nr:hypothetical protein JOQ06_000659 [Pogonophryne albipinna]
MDGLTLFYSLILPLCLGSEVTIMKTIGRGPDVTEICVNTTQSNITLIVCKIGTERNAECLLLYEPIEGFMHQCDSRFSLKMENQTVSPPDEFNTRGQRIHQGVCSRSATSGSSACENPGNLEGDDPDDPYTALQQPDSDLCQSVSNSAGREMSALENQKKHGRETDASCKLYANM